MRLQLLAIALGMIDSVDLAAVPEDEHVIWLVRGSEKMHIADYQALATVGRSETRFGGPSPESIVLLDPVAPARTVNVPSRSTTRIERVPV